MIIDVRYNGGGFVDQLIFERLRRILVGMQSARNWKSTTIPDITFDGYMACIANGYTASDGDFFAHFFKKYKLGPLVGERTWGGVRGIRGYIPLIDGGYVTRPEFSLYGLDSEWQIENVRRRAGRSRRQPARPGYEGRRPAIGEGRRVGDEANSGSIRKNSPGGLPIYPPIPPDRAQTAGDHRSRRSPAVARRTCGVYEFFVIGAFHACAALGRSTVRTSCPASLARIFEFPLSAGFDRLDRWV